MAKQMTNDFGITFVDEADVPPAPRKNDRNPALWTAIGVALKSQPGQWAAVRTYDKPGSAGVKASNINNGKNKTFSADEYEARYSKTDTESVLFMRYVGSGK